MSNVETVSTDILIIGGGPSGLATSIHLADTLKQKGLNKRILLIEKGSSIGSHIISGAVIKADVFKTLLPDVDFSEIPFNAKVATDSTVLLSENGSFKLPVHVPYMSNAGNYTASLGQVCRFLATKAEEKGVEIYTGFSVSEILYKDGKVIGDVWNISILGQNDKTERCGYPTQKPLELIERIIKSSSNETDLVADFYLGSGTTAIACKNTNRNFKGCEISKEYFDKVMLLI